MKTCDTVCFNLTGERGSGLKRSSEKAASSLNEPRGFEFDRDVEIDVDNLAPAAVREGSEMARGGG